MRREGRLKSRRMLGTSRRGEGKESKWRRVCGGLQECGRQKRWEAPTVNRS